MHCLETMYRVRATRSGIAGCCLLGCLLFGSLVWPLPARGEEAWQRPFLDKELLLCLQGKGASMAFDGGVLREMFDRMPALRDNRVMLTGNSSGGILAVYFSCFGFDNASLNTAAHQLVHADREVIRKMQDAASLSTKLILGKRTEIEHIELKHFVAFALGVPNSHSITSFEQLARLSRAKPKLPMLIIAGNKEVLDARRAGDLLATQNYKVLNPKNCSVSWHPEVHEYYRAHPERFAKDHPHLKLGDTPYIGKGVTYFVDRQMFDLLRQIPAEERTGDLRLIETPEDMILAILATVAEPSYFDPVPDRDPGKILSGDVMGDLGNVRDRTYCGGVYMMMPAQDIRRMLPGIRVFGTGWSINPYAPRELLKSWYLCDIEEQARLNGWWADMELQPSDEVKRQMIITKKLTPAVEQQYGIETAREALNSDRALPAYVTKPYYDAPAAKAIPPADTADAIETLPNGKKRLKTMRGLGKLVEPAGAR